MHAPTTRPPKMAILIIMVKVVSYKDGFNIMSQGSEDESG
jgi:hypothetical protein